jgi:hypothetical protein
MKLIVEKFDTGITFALPSGAQLFYGSSPLQFMQARYDHTDERLWPKIGSWEEEYVKNFLDEGCTFMGVFLLWHLSRLDVLKPRLTHKPHFVLSGRVEVAYEYNIHLDGHFILVNVSNCECRDMDTIIEGVTKSFERFDLDTAFTQIVEAYLTIYPPVKDAKLTWWQKFVLKYFVPSKVKKDPAHEKLSIFKEKFFLKREQFLAQCF